MFHNVLVTMSIHLVVACLLNIFASLCPTSVVVSPFISAFLFIISSSSVIPNTALYNTCGGTLFFSSSLSCSHAVAVATFCILFHKFFCPLQLARCACVSFSPILQIWHSVVVYTSGLLLLSSSSVDRLFIMHLIAVALLVLSFLEVQYIPLVLFISFQKLDQL